MPLGRGSVCSYCLLLCTPHTLPWYGYLAASREYLIVSIYVQWSIFQMRIADMMELLPGQKTAPNSLSVNARVCAKFAAPLCFFYLGWIFENGTKTGVWTEGMDGSTKLTAFARFYQIQVIPVVGEYVVTQCSVAGIYAD